ncbi:limonene-1,2-epoxide hydrolase family protein [Nocardioides montaniterrae]
MAPTTNTTPNTLVVEALFAALVDNDVVSANELLTDDIAWLNTKLPTLRGRRVRHALASMPKLGIRFSAEDYELADLGDGLVRFDRRDTLGWGPLSSTFAVSGTFTVRDGKISRWDDAYSMGEFLGGFVRRG